jgi:hypothetical protein
MLDMHDSRALPQRDPRRRPARHGRPVGHRTPNLYLLRSSPPSRIRSAIRTECKGVALSDIENDLAVVVIP